MWKSSGLYRKWQITNTKARSKTTSRSSSTERRSQETRRSTHSWTTTTISATLKAKRRATSWSTKWRTSTITSTSAERQSRSTRTTLRDSKKAAWTKSEKKSCILTCFRTSSLSSSTRSHKEGLTLYLRGQRKSTPQSELWRNRLKNTKSLLKQLLISIKLVECLWKEHLEKLILECINFKLNFFIFLLYIFYFQLQNLLF